MEPGSGEAWTGQRSEGGGGGSHKDTEDEAGSSTTLSRHLPPQWKAVSPQSRSRPRREVSGHHGWGGGYEELAHTTPSRDGADPGADPGLPGNGAGPGCQVF